MLAILYIAAMVYFGDCLCRRFYRFTSIRHRFATAFLVGLLLSSGITYLGALAFASAAQPMIMGNIVFLGVLILAAVFLRRPSSSYLDSEIERPAGSGKWDWLCLGFCFVIGCWLLFSTLGYKDGSFQFAFKSWSDFGANLSLSQSFVLGHNFPSEHPFFPAEPLRYHFLFWFQAANLSFLGFNLIWGINLLSVFSLMALLILIMTFTELMFGSRIAGRIAAVLFFFPATSLAYVPFLRLQTSVGGALNSVLNATQYLPTGYPFRGDDWGALTVAVFANQRQLISGAGILFVVMIFLVDFYRHKTSAAEVESAPIEGDEISRASGDEISSENNIQPEEIPVANSEIKNIQIADSGIKNDQIFDQTFDQTTNSAPRKDFPTDVQTLLFSGFLTGALPYWNSAVFVAASIILGSLLILFPLRRYMIFLIGAAVLTGLPQILLLRSSNLAPTSHSLFHWGYTMENPTVPLIAEYLAWTFGFKWILLIVALWFCRGFHRRLFLALLSLIAVVFLFQLSTDAFNNHKLLNIWNIFAGIFAAYALWRIGRGGIIRIALAAFLAMAMILSAIIDLFPVHNDSALVTPYENDRLTVWLLENTKPTDVFLTQTLLSHPILFTGRKVFLANTLFAWTAGYNVGARENVYRQMFQERNLGNLIRLLHENKIAYVAIDDGVRGNDLVKGFLNESVYKASFEKVFEDTERRYANLTIYKVPESVTGDPNPTTLIIYPPVNSDAP
jgi:hypothetical protein